MNSDEKAIVDDAVESSVKDMIADLCKDYEKLLDKSDKAKEMKKPMLNSFALGIMQGINLANNLNVKIDVSLK